MIHRTTPLSAALAAIVVVAGSFAPVALADEVPFPFDTVDRHTFVVGFVDLSRTTSASLGASAKLIVGEELAAEAAGPLAQLDAMLKPLLDAGAERAYFAAGTPDPQGEMREPVIQVYVRHKAGADRAALAEAAEAFDMRDSQVTPIGDRWLRLEPPAQKSQPGLIDATRATLAADLIAVDHGAVGVALVNMEAVRQMMGSELADMERRYKLQGPASEFEVSAVALGQALLAMKSTRISLILGDRPTFGSTFIAADADAATRAAAAYAAMRQKLDEAIANVRADLIELAVVRMMLDLVKPAQAGATLSINLETDRLRMFGHEALAPAIVQAREAAKQTMALNHIRQILMGAQMYAADHEGKLPDSVAAMAEYVGDLDRLLTHPATGEKPGFEYVKPAANLADIANPGTTPMVYELRNGKRHDQGAIGYADGHVERPPPPEAR